MSNNILLPIIYVLIFIFIILKGKVFYSKIINWFKNNYFNDILGYNEYLNNSMEVINYNYKLTITADNNLDRNLKLQIDKYNAYLDNYYNIFLNAYRISFYSFRYKLISEIYVYRENNIDNIEDDIYIYNYDDIISKVIDIINNDS